MHEPFSKSIPKYPQVKKQLWGGELWEDGYVARTVGDKVTAEVIKKYIQHHREEKDHPQLDLFSEGGGR